MTRILLQHRFRALLALCALLAAACGGGEQAATSQGSEGVAAAASPDPAEPSDDDPLVIGWSAPYSGPAAALGPFVGAGAEIALRELNNSFDGREVVYKTYDDKDEPATAIAVAQEAIQKDGVDVMIGPAQSRTAAATIETYTAAEIPQFMTGATLGVVGPDFPYVYRMMYNTSQQSEILVEYAVDVLEQRDVGIFVVHDELGTSNREDWTRDLGERDLEPVAAVEMPPGTTDATGLVRELQTAGADVILAYANGADGAVLLQAMNDIGFDVPVVGHAGFALNGFRSLVTEIDTDQVYSTFFCAFTGEPSPRVAEFIDKAKQQVYDGGDFVEAAAYQGLTYDIIYVIQEAYRNGGGRTDAASLVEGLKQVQGYEGLMGTIDFSDDNEGWGPENITVVRADSYDPVTGTFPELAPGASCG